MGLFNETTTSTALGNTGLQNYPGTVGKWKHLVLVPKGTTILTKVLALTQATWVNGMNAAMTDRWFFLPLIFLGEPNNEDPVREESDFGYVSFVRDGKLTYKISFEEMSVYNKNQIFKLNNGSFDMYVITDKDVILGYSDDATKVRPFRLDYHRFLPETPNTGSTNARVQLEVRPTNVNEFNELQVALYPVSDADAPANWYPTVVLPPYAVKDLIISASGMTATGATIVLKGYDNTPYSGAVKEDVYLRKTTEDGTAIPLSSLTESGTVPGTYTAVFGTQTSGTFYYSLYNQPDATTQGVQTPVVFELAATIA